MRAVYGKVSNIKPLASQQVTRIEIEIPIEYHVEATSMLFNRGVLVTLSPRDFEKYGIIEGAEEEERGDPPRPAGDASGVAPIGTAVTNEAEHKAFARGEHWKSLGPLCQSAIALCQDRVFLRFVSFASGEGVTDLGDAEAADFIRSRCEVESRKQLDEDPEAKQRFKEMMAEYREWLQAEQVA